MLARRAAAVLALLALAAGVPTVAKKKKDERPELSEWIRGPIRYIARAQEARDCKALESDNDRALFIERFWTRRDPTPQTLVNEYRQMFWERVNEANASFHGSTRPGWMTDRGKIHILYGPPSEIRTEHDLATEGLPTAGRGLIRWIYQGRPGGRMDVDPITVVAFVRDTTGEYRLSRDPTLNSVFFDPYIVRDRPFGQWTDVYLAPTESELSVMLDLGKLQEVPPQEQVLLERVETIESYRTFPLDVRIDRYRHPEDEGWTVATTVRTGASVGASPAVIARFTPHDATRAPRIVGEGSFRAHEHDDRRAVQGRIVLEPGTYDVMVLSANPYDASTGMHRATIVIPAPSEALALSDVTLARWLEPLEYRALVSYDEPFVIGPYRLLPRFDSALRPGESLDVLFEVYGGQPPYRVSYQLDGQEEDGRWIALGRPQTNETSQAAQAWGLPTRESWPLGEYRVRIAVVDSAGATLDTVVPFRLGVPE